jgi:autotransporter-associated beta strand protein
MSFTSLANVTVQAAASVVFTGLGEIANTVVGSSVFLAADTDSDGNGGILDGNKISGLDVATGSVTATASSGISLAFSAASLSATNSHANGISLVGSGSTQVTNLNAHSGLITIGGGNFTLASGTTLNPASALDLGAGSLDLGGTHQTLAGVTLTSGSILDGSLTTSALTAESGSIGASLAGSFTLVKTSSGIVTLSAANTYTGGTDISQGVLEFSNPGLLGRARSS